MFKKKKPLYLDSEIENAKRREKDLDLEIQLESIEVTIATKKMFLNKIRSECFTKEKLEAYLMVHALPGVIPISREQVLHHKNHI